MAEALKAEIEACNEKFMTAFNAGDLDALSLLYTEDCKLMPTGADTMTGRDAVKTVFGGVRSGGGSSVKLTVDEVGVLHTDEMIYERSCYEFSKADGSTMDKGKYVVIWKKVGDQWLLYTDIFNSSQS